MGSLPSSSAANGASILSASRESLASNAGRRPTGTFQTLYSFGKAPDAANPSSKLLDVGGTLYGVTLDGGPKDHGTFYKFTTTGQETVVYRFPGLTDGNNPSGDLIVKNGEFYGTTSGESRSNTYGTVFKTSPSGDEHLIFRFNGTDGASPDSGVIEVNGALYGTTSYGGGPQRCIDCGTLFKVTLSGRESVLHRFKNGSDGSEPHGGLVNVNGVLYGVAARGGLNGCINAGCGTVFKINPDGTGFRTIYEFKGGSVGDGGVPYGRLLYLNGTFYGTTFFGGGTGCAVIGCGTIFSLTPSGTETVVYRFQGSPDGANPFAALISYNGALYGTTFGGGGTACEGGCGTLFTATLGGEATTLHSFSNGSDGGLPSDRLSEVNATLYGVTPYGGADNNGTVFSFTP